MRSEKYPFSVYDNAISITDKWGNDLTLKEDLAAIKAEEARRIWGYGELPDIDETFFESFEDYEEWIAEGRKRFSCQ